MPIDHEYFRSINNAQWYWYMYQFMEDQNEEFQYQRNLIEYHASFIEPETVSRTRKRRDELEASERKDSGFTNTIKALFGRDIAFKGHAANESDMKNVHEVSDLLDRVGQYNQYKQIKNRSKYNYIDWLEFSME